MARNIIYYGPPGTGKTYLLRSLMNDYIDYEMDDAVLKRAFVAESKGWILIALVLLQNHGKMPSADVQRKIDGLSLGLAVNAAAELDLHSIAAPPVAGAVRKLPRVFFTTGPDTWYVDLVRVQQARPDFFAKFLRAATVTKRYDFVTFHQSYSYEDFMEGIRPEYEAAAKSIDYSPKDGVFKRLCGEAEKHPEKEYAIFIDEINRGNVSEIFGELISLLEPDKRAGEAGALSAVLPYSKTEFSVPANVNVYGTMNTADRSIDQIDIALRRRFQFRPMLPDAGVIEKELGLQGVDAHNVDGIDLIRLFNTLNARIELLLDAQHLLGHALFTGCKSAADIARTVRSAVVPLLEEYFFDDVQKIQLVFNDLDPAGDLRPDAVYRHAELAAEDYFPYTGDYMIDDKKHYFVSENITNASLEQIYL